MESPGLNRLGYNLPGLLDVSITSPASGNVLQYDGQKWTNANVMVPTGSYEPSLGNPLVDGYVLSSTVLGIRSWIAPETPSPGGNSVAYAWFLS